MKQIKQSDQMRFILHQTTFLAELQTILFINFAS